MRRTEKKLFKLNDEIVALKESERLARDELTMHQHLNDDAVRDAAVSVSPFDREDVRETGGDVARFERHLERLVQQRERLEARRMRIVERLEAAD